MSLGMIIVMLIAGWLAVAIAMLWGVMRISRRHYRQAPPPHFAPNELPKREHIKRPPAITH